MSESYQQIAVKLPDEKEQDCINLLVRDPHWLYVYWDISESRKEQMTSLFGNELAGKTIPVLKVTNVSKKESFFIRINEFSTDWYINVDDSNNTYIVEIGRKTQDNFFIGILNSNMVVTPGDCVSSDTTAYFINYNHLKEGTTDLGMLRKIGSHAGLNPAVGYPGTSSLEFLESQENKRFMGVSSFRPFDL